MRTLLFVCMLSGFFIPTVSARQLEEGVTAPSQRTRREQVYANRVRQESLPKNDEKNEKTSDEKKEVTGELLEVLYENSDFYTFGAQVVIENRAEKFRVNYVTKAGSTPPTLKPGTYTAYTEASRKGFPQEAKYQIVDVVSGNIVEEFPRTHVPVNNIILEKGQKLRIVVLPATRPYNSAFFRIGKQRTPAAILFNRPYPSFEFEPGEFHGPNQFPSAQIAIAFWGMKHAEEYPELAEKITREGVPGLRSGDKGRIRDPILVLGVREIARDLAETFIKDRDKNYEDSRGQYHVSFLVQRSVGGKISRSLLTMPAKELADEFEKQILWLEMHNVHRAFEGGGYGGKTFLDVVEEAKQKAKEWPRVSYLSTEFERGEVGILERTAADVGMDTVATFPSGESGVVRRLLKGEIKKLVKAIRRERMNYETYEEEWLQDVVAAMGTSVTERLRTLAFTEKLMLDRLEVLDPSDVKID